MEPAMSSPKQIRLDPIPLREMLRSIRFMVKQGGETLKANATPARLPKPAADLANTVIDELMGLGHRVNARASVLAKTMIGTEPDTDIMLDDLADRESADALFAATVYAAMKIVLARMKVSGVFVSEAGAKRAFASERNAGSKLSGFQLAASLTSRLIDGQFLRAPFVNAGRLVPDGAVMPVAVFAVLLWLQSPRQEDDQEEALLSAVDLSVILANQIEAGCRARDIEAIGALYAKYASNV
jgi:hypothetical protein